jgi:hypothetical protein
MLDLAKIMQMIVNRTQFFRFLLLAACFGMLSGSVAAQCDKGWNASGILTIRQRGQFFFIKLTMEQKGKVITGTADHIADNNGGVRQVEGTVDGTLEGDNFSIQIFWPEDLTGVYNAKILPSGRLDGETFDKNNSRIRQPFHSEGLLRCGPPPPATPKPIRASGRARTTTTATPEPPKPPFIAASQPIFVTPGHPFASVILSWDAGPDHPNVEVWLSRNSQPESPASSMDLPAGHPLFKQTKAAFEIKLPRGSGQYKYVLKAGGKTLSTVSVVVP